MSAQGVGRMHPVTAEIWRYVRDCGDTGAWSQDIYLRFTEEGQRAVTRVRINTLVLQDFIKGQGDKRNRLYHVTDKVPVGQSLQLHAPEEARQRKAKPTTRAGREELSDDDTEALFAPRQAVPGVPPGVPNSVFALGTQAAGLPPPRFDLPPARNGVPPPLSAAALASQPQPAVAVAPKPAPEPEPKPAPEPAPVPAPAAKPHTRFALQSTGELVIQYPGPHTAPIELPPDVTRALFRFLDLLSGTSLASIMPQEAA